MGKQSPGIQWIYFLVFGGGLVLLLMLESRLEVSEAIHRGLQVAIVLVVYGLLAVWEQDQAIRQLQRESEYRQTGRDGKHGMTKPAQPTRQPEKKTPWPSWARAIRNFFAGFIQ